MTRGPSDEVETPSITNQLGTGIRVLVVDRHTIVAEGLRQLFAKCSDIHVIDVAASASSASAKASESRPDVVLIDDQLPDADSVTAVAEIKRKCPHTQVVLLTELGEDYTVVRKAFEAGCSAVLDKSRSVEELFSTVRAATAGEVVMSASLFQKFSRAEERWGLSRRELEILVLIAEGGTSKEVAELVCISVNTVRKHVQNIIQKMGAHSKLEAVVIASREGIIRPL